MSILSRYLAASFVVPFLASTSFFVIFLLTFQLFRLTELIISKEMSVFMVIKMLGHISVTFLPMAVPLSLFFAVLYCMNKLSNDSEFVVMRSFGMSKWKIFLPFALSAILVSLSLYSLNQEIIPYAKREFRKTVNYLKSAGLFSSIKSGHFFTELPQIALFAQEVDKETMNMEKVFIHVSGKKGPQQKIIFSEKGKMIMDNQEYKSQESLRLELTDGNIVDYKNGNEVEKIIFKTYEFPIASRDLDLDLGVKASYWSRDQLNHFFNMSDEERKKNKYNKDDYSRAKFEFWNRINTPVTCLLFTFLGFMLGIKDNRSQRSNNGVISIGVIILYYALFFSGVSIARKEIVHTAVAVFAPSLILLVFGLYYSKKIEWNA